MSAYVFQPSPSFGISEHPFATWQNGFSPEEIKTIIDYCETLEKNSAIVGGYNKGDDISQIRESNVSWVELNSNTGWLYDRLSYVARQLNGQFYRFNLFGFQEHFQYTVYESSTNGHYTWHRDTGVDSDIGPRKLSLVLQLTDPSEYEGGELELLTSANPQQVTKELGLISVFPSYNLHRVTPVTSGTRRTLVAWITGPAFV